MVVDPDPRVHLNEGPTLGTLHLHLFEMKYLGAAEACQAPP